MTVRLRTDEWPTGGFRLHGLDVISAIDLHRPAVIGDPDVRITVGEPRPVPLHLPSGEILAALEAADGTPYTPRYSAPTAHASCACIGSAT